MLGLSGPRLAVPIPGRGSLFRLFHRYDDRATGGELTPLALASKESGVQPGLPKVGLLHSIKSGTPAEKSSTNRSYKLPNPHRDSEANE